jgi:molybdopterin-containing oxidoreductase family iron-sulfur binding subunit
MGIASGAALSACKVNNADKKLLPYLVPPEEGIIPGVPRYVSSTCMECPAHCGINVKILDDKPVKLEGHADHPVNKGSLCLRGQASLARLYHPERIKQPLLKGADGTFKPVSWKEATERFHTELKDSQSKGLRNAFLSSRTSGTLSRLIDEFCQALEMERLKEMEIYHHGSIKQVNQLLFGLPLLPHYRIDQCDALVTVDADLFETFLSPVEWGKQYAEAREKYHIKWYHIEPYLTLTGASANQRAVINPGSEPYLLAYLVRSVTPRNPIPGTLMAQVPEYSLDKAAEITGMKKETIQGIKDTLEKAKAPLIISGGAAVTKRNGPITACYTALLQWMLGMMGKTVDFDHAFNHGIVGTINDLVAFASDCRDKKVGTAVFSRLYGFTAMPAFVEVMKGAGFKVAIATTPGPITEMCDLVLPLSPPLESWDDAEPRKGVQSLIQPVVKPLQDTKSQGEILLTLLGRYQTYRDYLANHWRDMGMDEQWIERGFNTTEKEAQPIQLAADAKLEKPDPPYRKPSLYIVPSLRTFDGRSSDIALLEEIPDPITAISYGRWMGVSPSDAQANHLGMGDMMKVETIVGDLKVPGVLVPGLPPGVMTIAVDALTDTDMQLERGSGEFMLCLEDIKLTKTGETIKPALLAGAKETGKRGILPHLERHDHHHKHKRHSLHPEHEHKDYRWGMVIDLSLCTGCSACAAACYIENNVPVVGKAEHLKGREMSWLRIEPYYNDPQRPEFVPMMCQQCDYAPCETVCPVYATYHNPEGLNAQVYNRCVGTRYCANNCPYKVRRVKWFDHAPSLPLYRGFNPDLSVRPKGVMEKCSFCIQRIRFAKDRAKDEKRLVKDGEIIPACAQTCPTGAIIFGNLKNPDSKVSRLIKAAGAYRILEQLGTEPAVYYFASGGQGGFFEKPPPWTPRKTSV